MDLPTRLAGIPCIARVHNFFVQPPMGPSADSDLDCYGYEEIDYAICDQRGRPAPWLEKKLTDKDAERICNEISAAYQLERNHA